MFFKRNAYLLFAWALFSCNPLAQAANGLPPNVILMMSDDLGWGDVGFNGNTEVRTPHLDAMAANGARFDRFYAASPLCSPTRGSCLTGRHPFRFGILAAHTAGLRVGEITLAEILRDKGYATGFFGKWHLGWVEPDEMQTRGMYSPPSHHGFGEWFATTSAVPTWNPTVVPQNWNKWGEKEGGAWKGGFPYLHDGRKVSENLSGDDSRVIMDRVLPFIEKHKDQRFLATVWFHAPHEPVVAGETYRQMYAKSSKQKQDYYGCITAMDEQIGRLRARLREWGIADQTLILFCSDNGPADALAKKGVASAGAFKGHKHTMNEGGLLVPSCAEWPGMIAAGTTTAVRCSTVDYFPTVANLVGYTFPAKHQRPLDGIDLLPVIRGGVKERAKDLYFGFQRLHEGIDGQALIRGNHKLLQEATKAGKGRTLLFDLEADPGETTDLAAARPELFAEMQRRMREMETDCQRSRDGADYSY